MSNQCSEFFSRPAGAREKLFQTYSLEDQLTIYRCGMNRVPPDTYLASYIADRGNEVIPILLERLKTEPDEFSQYAIVDIFEMLAVKGHMQNRTDVAEEIRRVVNQMKIDLYRKMAAQSLERIDKDIK